MSQRRWRLIFGEKDVHLQDFDGREIRTFQKSDFLISGGRYRVTESLLGYFSEELIIEINVPIEVEVTFQAHIDASESGARAYATAYGARAYATADGAIAYANVDGAEAYATTRGAIAYADVTRAYAHANADGAIAYANADGAIAYANAPRTKACANK